MSINLEQIDELRKRANVSYEDAKEALEKFDGNLVDALIYLEKNKRIKSFSNCAGNSEFFNKSKHAWKKGNKIRLVIKRNNNTIANLPLAITLLVSICTMHISIPAVIIALIFGCRFSLENVSGDTKINEALSKVHDNINNIKNTIKEEL